MARFLTFFGLPSGERSLYALSLGCREHMGGSSPAQDHLAPFGTDGRHADDPVRPVMVPVARILHEVRGGRKFQDQWLMLGHDGSVLAGVTP